MVAIWRWSRLQFLKKFLQTSCWLQFEYWFSEVNLSNMNLNANLIILKLLTASKFAPSKLSSNPRKTNITIFHSNVSLFIKQMEDFRVFSFPKKDLPNTVLPRYSLLVSKTRNQQQKNQFSTYISILSAG